MKEKIKISDIARMSGVSVSTVSLALNNKPGVSQETRLRVFEIAQQFEYPLKSTVSSGKDNDLTTIAMVVKTDPDIPPMANPFYSKVIMGIEDSCRRTGINLLFATLPVDENNHPLEAPQLLYNESVDGMLLVGVCLDETFTTAYARRKLPIVLVDGYSTAENYDTVISDNFRAAYQAVEYLIENGHRQIGLIGSDTGCYPSLKDRRNGYLRALKEKQISRTVIANFNINKSKGYQETIDLLQDNPQISALFCVNDDVGSAAIRAAQSLGRRVPGDISIIGFDDTYLAANTHPTLTTMHVDTTAMGRAAVQLLSLRLGNPASARMTLTIHPTLVIRESVSQAPSQSPTTEASLT
jgi:LacI family transcriptional regulator